jgi:hypothetical protein
MNYRLARLSSRSDGDEGVYARNPVCGQIGVGVGVRHSETQRKVERRDGHELDRPPARVRDLLVCGSVCIGSLRPIVMSPICTMPSRRGSQDEH